MIEFNSKWEDILFTQTTKRNEKCMDIKKSFRGLIDVKNPWIFLFKGFNKTRD